MIEWSNINGALPKPKRLHLERDNADALYHCPIQSWDRFQNQRGCRRHVNNEHSWFFYFDEKPRVDLKLALNSFKVQTKSFGASSPGEEFTTCLKGSGGGYKKDRPAQQVVSRCLKFLKFCCEEEGQLSFDVMDLSLCSPNLLFKFID